MFVGSLFSSCESVVPCRCGWDPRWIPAQKTRPGNSCFRVTSTRPAPLPPQKGPLGEPSTCALGRGPPSQLSWTCQQVMAIHQNCPKPIYRYCPSIKTALKLFLMVLSLQLNCLEALPTGIAPVSQLLTRCIHVAGSFGLQMIPEKSDELAVVSSLCTSPCQWCK